MVEIIGALIGKDMDPLEILYDPNNPRLWDIRKRTHYSDDQIPNPSLQDQIEKDLRNGPFDIERLMGSIAKIGFLEVDKIVVRSLLSDELKFVVVEGNRRLAAIKWLLEIAPTFKPKLPDYVQDSIKLINVLVIDHPKVPTDLVRWTLQGVRHLSGVKDWQPYQQAVAIKEIMDEFKMDEGEATELLGIGKRKAYPLLRALGAFIQMREDNEFGDYVETDMFSYFLEAVKYPKIREYFSWDDDMKIFGHNPEILYSWLTPDPDTDEKKVPTALDIRGLAKVLGSAEATEYFLEPRSTLTTALTYVRAKLKSEWRERINDAIKALNQIPITELENLSKEDEEKLETLLTILQKRLKFAKECNQS